MTTWYNYIKRSLKQASNKKVRPHEIQEGDFVPKKVLSSQQDSKDKWAPNPKGSCAIHLQLWMVTNSHVLWKPMQSRNTLSKKIKLDKSQTRKGGLGKNERLGGLKTWKGGPGKN